MYIKTILLIVLLEFFGIVYATNLKSNKLIQDICDQLDNYKNLQIDDENQQWEFICKELSRSKHDSEQPEESDNTVNKNSPQNNGLSKAVRTIGIRTPIRGGSTSRGGSSVRNPIRTGTTYRNTRTGTTISRPTGWVWSRSRMAFLPLSTIYLHRIRSSSNRYTTPATSSLIYYYCTSSSDTSKEIQCNNANGDSKCCEDQTNQQPFCCGGAIPDDFIEDPNRATHKLAQVFYTLAAVTLCLHLFMRRFNR